MLPEVGNNEIHEGASLGGKQLLRREVDGKRTGIYVPVGQYANQPMAIEVRHGVGHTGDGNTQALLGGFKGSSRITHCHAYLQIDRYLLPPVRPLAINQCPRPDTTSLGRTDINSGVFLQVVGVTYILFPSEIALRCQ